MKKKVLWRVDVQNDFMKQDYKGKPKDEGLYVPGAEGIIKNIEALIKHGRNNKIPLYGSVDAHIENDPEFKIYPKHCIIRHPGQKEIDEVDSQAVYIKSNEECNITEFEGLEEIILEKQHPNVFTNINAGNLVEKDIETAVVCGVATDICVFEAVKGLTKHGVKVYVVKDAIKGLGGSREAVKEMKEKYGVRFVSTKEVLEGKII